MFEELDKTNQIESQKTLLIYYIRIVYQEFKMSRREKRKRKKGICYIRYCFMLFLDTYIK